jgi:cytidine deaminase
MEQIPYFEANELMEKARMAARNTYSPYSKFPVGAAVLTADGAIFRGTNIENASSPIGICAERVAISSAIADGKKTIKAIAIYANTDSVSPCGICRQFISEFGKDILIIFRHEGEMVQKTIHELLPYAFNNESMA